MPDVANEKSKKEKFSLDERIKKKYDIVKRLGKGAYGVVWKVSDKTTKETKAIKKIFDAFRDPIDAKRTFREVTILKAFDHHPNIIKMIDVHRAVNDLDLYLTFEYMQSDLNHVIKMNTVLKDVHKRYIMYQLMNAIKYIHAYNIVHRDLKPSNILIDTKCKAKIGDFGLARKLPVQTNNKPNTNTNFISKFKQKILTEPDLTEYVATRWYRAPEILSASKMYSKSVDIWSLGCILGELFSGKPIFQGASTTHQIEVIANALPDISEDDISAVITGLGNLIINLDPNRKKTTLKELVPSVAPDGMNLLESLLVFNPKKRLTAHETLHHNFFDKVYQLPRFRNLTLELEPNRALNFPVKEDIILSVPEYRTMLYEFAQIQPDARIFIKQKSIAIGKSIPDSKQKPPEIRRYNSDIQMKSTNPLTEKTKKMEKANPHLIAQMERDWNRNEKMQNNPKPGSYLARKEYNTKQTKNDNTVNGNSLKKYNSTIIITKDGKKLEKILLSENPLTYQYVEANSKAVPHYQAIQHQPNYNVSQINQKKPPNEIKKSTDIHVGKLQSFHEKYNNKLYEQPVQPQHGGAEYKKHDNNKDDKFITQNVQNQAGNPKYTKVQRDDHKKQNGAGAYLQPTMATNAVRIDVSKYDQFEDSHMKKRVKNEEKISLNPELNVTYQRREYLQPNIGPRASKYNVPVPESHKFERKSDINNKQVKSHNIQVNPDGIEINRLTKNIHNSRYISNVNPESKRIGSDEKAPKHKNQHHETHNKGREYLQTNGAAGGAGGVRAAKVNVPPPYYNESIRDVEVRKHKNNERNYRVNGNDVQYNAHQKTEYFQSNTRNVSVHSPYEQSNIKQINDRRKCTNSEVDPACNHRNYFEQNVGARTKQQTANRSRNISYDTPRKPVNHHQNVPKHQQHQQHINAYGEKIAQLEEEVEKYKSDVKNFYKSKQQETIHHQDSTLTTGNNYSNLNSKIRVKEIPVQRTRIPTYNAPTPSKNLRTMYTRPQNLHENYVDANGGGGDFLKGIKINEISTANNEHIKFQHKHEFRAQEHRQHHK